MKKVVIYVLVLVTLVTSIVAYHVSSSQDYLSQNPHVGYIKVLEDERYLHAYFKEDFYNENNHKNPYASVLKGDAFLLRFTDADSTLYYHVVEDSPSNMASIAFQIYEFNISMFDIDGFANFRQAKELKKLVDPTISSVISKKEFTETLRSSDVKYGQMTKIQGSNFSPINDALRSPFLVPFCLFLAFIVIWWARRFSDFFGKLVGINANWFLGGLVFIVIVLVWMPSVPIYSYDENGDKYLLWDLILSTYTIFRLSAIFIFIGFWYLVEKYSDAYDFADREAFKFFYIFFASMIYWVLSPYLHDYSFDSRVIPENVISDRSLKVSMQMFSESIIFATANLLNNFRAHYFELRRKGKSLLKAKTQSLQSTSELAALQSRVNPHFLYNSINSIAALAESDPKKTKKMALALSEFYKYSSNRQDELWTTIGEELDMIDRYLEIEKIRFGEKLKIRFERNSKANGIKIPRFLIHPLVENAIKYGYDKYSDEINIVISTNLETEGNKLTVSVSDSGLDFPEDLNMGYGLKSIYKKLKLTYPNSHHVSFRNDKGEGEIAVMKTAEILIENPKNDEEGGSSRG